MLAMMAAVDEVLAEIGALDAPRVARPRQGRPRRRGAPRASSASAIPRRFSSRRSPARDCRRSPSGSSGSSSGRLRPVELLIPYAEGGRLAELHELAGDLEREDTPEGVRVSARLRPAVAARFEPFAVGAQT